MSRRTERLGSLIRQELAAIMLRDLNDPRISALTSITRVKISPDLSIADVYLTVMGTETQQELTLSALRHSAGMMRAKLTREISLRQAPFLKFHIDEKLKKELAVLDLLRQVELERQAQSGGDNPADAADITEDNSTDDTANNL